MVHAIQFAFFIAFMLAGGAANAADDSASAWTALRADGHVALIRHASAPGPVGDPADYKLDDCATQRNLSEQGRAEARALGERFRTQRVKVGKIVSSQWCRCRQTAELMNIGPVEVAPTFNNAFVLNATRDALTAGARATIGVWRGPGTLVVVTHGQNIMAMHERLVAALRADEERRAEAEAKRKAEAERIAQERQAKAAELAKLRYTTLLRCKAAAVGGANEILDFEVAPEKSDGLKGIQIFTQGIEVSIPEVTVGHVGDGELVFHLIGKNLNVASNSTSQRLSLGNDSKPLSRVRLVYRGSRPPGSFVTPSLCIEGLKERL